MKKSHVLTGLLLLTLALAILLGACTRPTPTPPPTFSVFQLEYLLSSHFGEVFWCDPYLYPVGRPEQEQKDALEQFPAIRANEAEFSAILEHLNLPNKTDYTDAEKLLIFREHRELTIAVQITPFGDIYNFTLRVGEGQGYRYEGTITKSGKITVLKKETSFNTCPICLAKGTLIDTPAGPVPVEQLKEGMEVWTVDETGKRVMAPVVATTMTPVPVSFLVVAISLNDGRTITASPGHPTAEGRALDEYQVGDSLDGSLVVAVELVAYGMGATYDVLPAGTTGLYWANGVLLKSTLAAN